MDACLIDIVTEFLVIAFHNILYYCSVYPRGIFDSRRKYNVVVYRSIHPEVNKYIDQCVKSAAACLKTNLLNRIEFAVTDSQFNTLKNFVFQFDKNEYFDETLDAYLVQCEQNIRAFCLKLASLSGDFDDLPEECSFSIYLHTNESTAVTMSVEPDLEEFPLIEVEGKQNEPDSILPIRRFSIRSYNIDSYIEIK